jgi:hypothetical protein
MCVKTRGVLVTALDSMYPTPAPAEYYV